MAKYLSIYNDEEYPIITDNSKNFEFIDVTEGKNISGRKDELLLKFDYRKEIVGVQMLSSASIKDVDIRKDGLLLYLDSIEVASGRVDANKIKTNVYRFGTSRNNASGIGFQVFSEDGSIIYNSSNRQLKIIDNIKFYQDGNHRYILPFKRKRYPVDIAILPIYMPLLFIGSMEVEDWAMEYIYSELSIWMSDTKTLCLNEKRITELIDLETINKKTYDQGGIPDGATANILVFDVSGLG